MMAEVMGRVTGYCRGKGGEMHIADVSLGILGTNGIVGGGIGIAAGSAFTAKREGKGRVSVAFFGDGAINQGIWYETANISVLWKLPLIYVCENNQYTEFTHYKKLTSGAGLGVRAEAMGMKSLEVDGNDVLAVYQAAHELVETARQGQGPATLICNTFRYGGHHSGEPGTAYRSKEEIAEWKARDPLPRFEKILLDQKVIAPADIEAIHDEVLTRVQASVTSAQAAAFPDVSEVGQHVYA
jgi:pyruvate dehydrogenase E1 component alpha subunit